MNRQQRRSTSKEAKKKLSNEQFKAFKDMANEKVISMETDRRVTETFNKFTKDLIVAMREHRISEDRIFKVVKRTLEIGKERQANEKRISQ